MSMISDLLNNLKIASKDAEDADDCLNCKAYAYIMRQAYEVIEELSAKLASANMERSTAYYNDGWILCSERLPEEIFKDYLVCLKNGAIFIAQYSTKNEFRMVCTNAIQYFYKENPVIAWKPLPAPYQPKGEK